MPIKKPESRSAATPRRSPSMSQLREALMKMKVKMARPDLTERERAEGEKQLRSQRWMLSLRERTQAPMAGGEQ